MRRDFAIGLWLLVLAILGAELAPIGAALEYRRALAFAEPWRLLTAHYVHLSFLHACLNAVALILLGHLFADRLRPRDLFGMLAVAPILLSLAFWFVLPELQWYRGLSGVLHAIYFAGCVAWVAQTTGRARWLPVAALLGGTVKVLLEQPWDSSFPVHEVLRVAVVPQAHLVGAIVGAAAGLALRRRGQQAEPEQP